MERTIRWHSTIIHVNGEGCLQQVEDHKSMSQQVTSEHVTTQVPHHHAAPPEEVFQLACSKVCIKYNIHTFQVMMKSQI